MRGIVMSNGVMDGWRINCFGNGMEWNGMESIVFILEVSRKNWYKSNARIHNNCLFISFICTNEIL
jgi:hypothetical protein